MITKRPQFIFYCILTILIVFYTCKQDDQTRLQAGWSSKDPIAIPVNARNHEKNLGNLVKNPSFETGKIYYEKSSIKSYDLNGWKKVGQNIFWVNSNSEEFLAEEVFEGIHSVKIVRSSSDETEKTGEGIISDYIKVIPGNYSLKLKLKLKDIYPNQSRLGTKMYDAINIRFQYFDKNKIEIKGEELNAFTNSKLDNSFKAFSLSNYSHIKEFGWGEVFGKTANFPFFDGDIPDEARYVRIFIGLKGTGTMWIDQVDFRYTEQNFTLLERLKPYFDSSYMAYDMVFPQPKSIIKRKAIKYFKSDSSYYPVIVIPKNTSKYITESAMKFRDYLIKNDRVLIDKIDILDEIQLNDYSDRLVISIGGTDIYEEFGLNLPDSLISGRKEAYYIQQIDDLEKVVFVRGNSPEAYQNAIKTLVQLFDNKNSTFYGADIIDYPDFKERAIVLNQFAGELDELKNIIELLQLNKFNSLYFSWNRDYSNYPFNSLMELENDELKFGAIVNISENPNQSDLSDLLKEKYHNIVLNSSDSLNCDEFNSDKKCSSDFDIINEIRKTVVSKKHPPKLGFVPRWSNLSSIDKGYEDVYFYFYNLNQTINRDVELYWTGSSKYSSSVDYADLNRIRLIYNRAPSYIDNSLIGSEKRFKSDFIKQYYAGKIRIQSLFDPYQLNVCNSFSDCSHNPKILLNLKKIDGLETIRALTAVDYFWDTKKYDADKSLWIVLNKLYGRNTAINLLYFNDAYFGLKEVCQKIENNGHQYKNVRVAKNFENLLKEYYKKLESDLDHALLKELEVYTADLMRKYNGLISNLE